MKEKQWAETLAVGDEVAIPCGWGWGEAGYVIKKISKITPKQIVIGLNSRFWKKNLCEVGGGYNRIQKVTQEIRDKIEHRGLYKHLESVKWGTIPLEKLRTIHSAYITSLEMEK